MHLRPPFVALSVLALVGQAYVLPAELQDVLRLAAPQSNSIGSLVDRLAEGLGNALAEIRGSLKGKRPDESSITTPEEDDDECCLTSLDNTTFHSTYHPLFEIDHFIERLVDTYPERASLVSLGHSAQGREMFALRISKNMGLPGGSWESEWGTEGEREDDDDDEERRVSDLKRRTRTGIPGFVITGAQHAREWIASASAIYVAHALLANASEPHSLSHLLDTFDFHIIPVPNPDGYVYTWDYDRFWYKNRMVVGPEEPCQGLDMNRNWGYEWSPSAPSFNVDYSADDEFLRKKKPSRKPKEESPALPSPAPEPADPCSHWYPGHRPFEAPEVNNIANYITRTPRLEAFLDLRSYGQMLSTPFSYSCDVLPKDAEDQLEAALGVVHAVKKKHTTVYTTGSLCDTLYAAPGNIVDWMYGAAGIKYSYAAHLRDTGTYGYALPPQWIRPVGEETATMVDYLSTFIAKKPY